MSEQLEKNLAGFLKDGNTEAYESVVRSFRITIERKLGDREKERATDILHDSLIALKEKSEMLLLAVNAENILTRYLWKIINSAIADIKRNTDSGRMWARIKKLLFENEKGLFTVARGHGLLSNEVEWTLSSKSEASSTVSNLSIDEVVAKAPTPSQLNINILTPKQDAKKESHIISGEDLELYVTKILESAEMPLTISTVNRIVCTNLEIVDTATEQCNANTGSFDAEVLLGQEAKEVIVKINAKIADSVKSNNKVLEKQLLLWRFILYLFSEMPELSCVSIERILADKGSELGVAAYSDVSIGEQRKKMFRWLRDLLSYEITHYMRYFALLLSEYYNNLDLQEVRSAEK